MSAPAVAIELEILDNVRFVGFAMFLQFLILYSKMCDTVCVSTVPSVTLQYISKHH